MSDENLWRIRTFADYLDTSLDNAYRLVELGRVPGVVRLGPRSIRLDPEQVKQWVAEGGYSESEAVAK